MRKHLKIKKEISLAALLTVLGLCLGGGGESMVLAISQVVIYLVVVWLIVRAKS